MDIIQINPDTYHRCSPFIKSTGFTSLMYLVKNVQEHPEYLEQIKYILDNHPEELNKQNEKKWTALMLASSNDYSDITIDTLLLLLEYKPDLNILDNFGYTALYHSFSSSYEHNFSMFKILIDHGADVNIKYHDRNILMYIVMQNKNIKDICQYILENSNIDLESTDVLNRKVYDLAIIFNKLDIAELIKKYQDNSLDIKCALD